MIELYVEDKRVDLFEEEAIELNKTLKDIRDIGAVFSDFSQGFTVPATRRNNEIFKHYHRPDNLRPFSVLKRAESNLYIAGVFYKKGTLQLEDVKVKEGKPYAYSVTFYGEIGALNKLFGEDTLQELDLSDFDHSYNSETIKEGLVNGLASGVIYPLMSPKRAWIYNSLNSNHDPRNIHFHTGGEGHGHGVHFYELKPALPVTSVLSAIEDRYGVTFTGSFLNQDAIKKLYLWLHNREGYLYEDQDTQSNQNREHKLVSSDPNTSDPNVDWSYRTNTDSWIYVPASSSGPLSVTTVNTFLIDINALNIDCNLIVKKNGSLHKKVLLSSSQVGNQIGISVSANYPSNFEIFIERLNPNAVTYDFDIAVQQTSVASSFTTTTINTAATFEQDVILKNFAPDIKVAKFLDGLAKMHNLVISSSDGKTFELSPFDDFIGSGKQIDFNSIIDTREHTITSSEKYKKLEFKYQESDQIQQKQFRKANGRGYGDLKINFNFDTEKTLEIEVPFDQPYFTVLKDQNTGGYVDFPVYLSMEGVDDDGAAESYYGAPILFYHDGPQDISANTISFLDEGEDQFEISQIQSANTISDVNINTNTFTSNFSEDSNEYGLITQNDPANENNLYADYWSVIVRNSFNTQARIANVQAYLKLSTLWNLRLSDSIVWQGRKWRINTMNVNLQTGKAQIELITLQ